MDRHYYCNFNIFNWRWIDDKSHSTEFTFTRSQCMLLVGQQTRIDLPLYMYKLIVEEAWSMQGTSLPYGVFVTRYLEDHSVPTHDGELRTPVGSTINKATMSKSKGQGARGGSWLGVWIVKERPQLRQHRLTQGCLESFLLGWPNSFRTLTTVWE